MAVPHFNFTAPEQEQAKVLFARLVAVPPEGRREAILCLSVRELILLGGWCAEKNFMKVVKQKIDNPSKKQLIIDDHLQLHREVERIEMLLRSIPRLVVRAVDLRIETQDL
jgi:hypothetical protein